jgi:hypothetical protein
MEPVLVTKQKLNETLLASKASSVAYYQTDFSLLRPTYLSLSK